MPFLLMALLTSPLPAAEPPTRQAAAERLKWERKIVFYGEEDTGEWSLRVPDRDATEAAVVRYTELWKYDVAAKKWVKIDDGADPARIVPAARKPADGPPDTQVIARLPIKHDTIGLYYAKWRLNDTIDGATFCRLGPGLVEKPTTNPADERPKAPAGMMWTAVPVDDKRAELQLVPDPRLNTGQPAR